MRAVATLLSAFALSTPALADEAPPAPAAETPSGEDELSLTELLSTVFAMADESLEAALVDMMSAENQPWNLELCLELTCMAYDSEDGYSSWPVTP